MNLLRYFEGREIKRARETTQDLKRLVEIAKNEQRRSEDDLRRKLADRPMIAGALTGRRIGDAD